MNNNIYILYDNKIETTESLERFKKILVLAGFKDTVINSVSLDEYTTILKENNYNFYNFVIAINQTYKQINQVYSDKLNVPIFDFFSKEYTNTDKNIVLYGLLFSVSAIYEPAYKKFSWSVVQKFFTDYSEIVNQEQSTEENCDYLSNEPEVQEITLIDHEPQETLQEIVHTVESTSLEEQSEETFQAVHKEEKLSYDELLSFYVNTKNLISQFNKVQDQLKLIESYHESV